MIKSEYRLLVYRKVGRHKLVRRFRSYWRMSEWLAKIVETEDINNYYYKKQKIK